MGMTAATAGDDAPVAYRLRGVNLFASGVYRGKPWEPHRIQTMAVNAKRLAKLITPPAAPGHEDDEGWQKFVGDIDAEGPESRTDEPAAGWVDPETVRTFPDPEHPGHLILKGDIVNVPPEMAQKILSGEYQYGSSEIYDSFKDDFGKDYGNALRKFSFLGAEVPQCKRLGRLPMPEPMTELRRFSERHPGVFVRVKRVRNGSTVHTYAETTVMDRTSMIAAIQAAMPGLSQSTLDAMSDEALADLVKNIPTAQPVADPNAATPVAMGDGMAGIDPRIGRPGMFADGDETAAMSHEELVSALTELGEDPAELEGMSDEELQALLDQLSGEGGEGGEAGGEGTETMGDPAVMTRDELIADLTAAGQDANALAGISDDELRAMYAQLVGGATATAPAAPAVPAVAPMSEKRRRRMATAAFAERQSKALLRNLTKLNKFAEREQRRLLTANANAKRRDAQTFCESLERLGRSTPAHSATVLMPLLLAMDDTAPVHKFSDGKITRKVTAYELKKAQIQQSHPTLVRMGERIEGSADPIDGNNEVAKVRQFAEGLTDNTLKAGGYTSRQQFVEKFSELRKKKPDLTAEKYLGK